MKRLSICIAAMIILSCSMAVSAEKKEMTRQETMDEISKSLADNEEIFNMVPGLSSQKGEDGKVSYAFKASGLESLSKEDLDKLLVKVHQALVRIRTERIQRQIDAVRRADRYKAISAPPAPPSVPKGQPSTPKIPKTPPVPPARR